MPQFVMIGHDGPDGGEKRNAHRDAHVAHVESLDRQGRIALAGPIRNEAGDASVGAVIVFEAADLTAARALVDSDPYVAGGVFATLTVAPFNRVFPKQS